MEILTVGHGDQSIEEFLDLLRQHKVETLVDTRSRPFSSRHPQFSQRQLVRFLADSGIRYVFLGDKLGGKPRNPQLYSNGQPDYRKIAATASYREGLEILKDLARGDETVAIMCSEADYKQCHRYKLLSHSLMLDGVEVRHIVRDGSVEEHPAPQMSLFP